MATAQPDAMEEIIEKTNNASLSSGEPSKGKSENTVASNLAVPSSSELAQTPPRKKRQEDFEFLQTLGEGSYATVRLAHEKSTQRLFAIKVLDKRHIVKARKVKYVNIEKKVFARLGNHPLFVHLYYTFQDTSRLYFVLSYASNGELLHYIRKLGAFAEDCARFYAAELVCALEYMHGLNIIDRDLKPENILLSGDMHIKITDFGTARILDDCEEAKGDDPGRERASSFVGTAEYVSPELLKGEPVTKSADLWALGCIVYQLITSKPPFRGANEFQVFQKVTNLDYEMHDNFPQEPRDLISHLLVLDSTRRLGCDEMGGYAVLMNHPWFKSIDWLNLPTTTPPKLRPYLPPTADCGALESTINTGGDGGHTGPSHVAADSPQPLAEHLPMQTSKEREQMLAKQHETNKWSPFVPDDELILRSSLVVKHRGFWGQERRLILTDGPRLLYISPKTLQVKGCVPWSESLHTELKNNKTFFVHTPQRTFYFEDRNGQAALWTHDINEQCEIYKCQKAQSTTTGTARASSGQ